VRVDDSAGRAAAYLRAHLVPKADFGLILGSGLGMVREAFEVEREIPYGEIPGFPVSSVPGHRGRLALAVRRGKRILIMDGRVHFYEGYPLSRVILPVRTLAALGVSTVFVTNAAGGVDPSLRPGSIMIIEDHINMMWERMPGLSREGVLHRPFYAPALVDLAERIAFSRGIAVRRGTLLGTTGPSYETPSEAAMSRRIGADAVTMSTIPEVSACHCLGIPVLGFSLITNVAGSGHEGHQKVVDFAARAGHNLKELIPRIMDCW
jgi:purine-nucleoside phosphorylase